MKIGAFLLGGIAGAAAVIYLNRKSKNMMLSAFSSSSDSMGKAMDKARDNFASKSFKDTTVKNFSNASSGGLNEVDKIVNKDPGLKAAVSEIMKDSKETTTTIQ
ncbi:hypothetical protein [Paenibacillus aestuarii]|uniref:YtxH domain-containing protein n=1 Tax=Paenibacillus aestuarii TaxID=516965 RepID=A0ABW0K5W6_9BACL|nr:hypothetical protein [Paenibacillus aestuarii]